MEKHNCYRIGRTHRLGEGTGVDPGIVLKRSNKKIWHNGNKCQDPDKDDVEQCILITVELVVLEAVADVAVPVDSNPSNVEDGPNNAQAHQKPADLTVDIAQVPAIVKERRQDQRVWIDGHN